LPEELDDPLIGANKAEQHSKERCLSGAVRTENSVNIALCDAQGQVIDREKFVVALDEANCLDGRHVRT